MKKLTEAQFEKYWADIPQGAANPATYGELMKKWRCGRRYARYILSVLAVWDNGENEVLIRSSHNAGFYRSTDLKEIEAFRRETLSRGLACLAPLKQINRVLKVANDNTPTLFDLLEIEKNFPYGC